MVPGGVRAGRVGAAVRPVDACLLRHRSQGEGARDGEAGDHGVHGIERGGSRRR